MVIGQSGHVLTPRGFGEESELFPRVLDGVEDALLISSLEDGRILYVNQAFLRMTSFTRDAVVGRSCLEIELWVDPSEWILIVQMLERTGSVSDFETLFRTASGQTRSGGFSAELIEVRGTKLNITIGRDLIEAKRVRDELRQEEKRLEFLVKQAPLMLWSTDKDLRFTSFMRSRLAAPDVRPGQIIGTTLFEFCETEDAEVPMIMAHHRALRGRSTTFELEWRRGIYQTRVEPIRDAEGAVYGCSTLALDVTARSRKQSELRNALSEGETNFRAIIETAGHAIVASDDHGLILYFNPAAERTFGYDAADVVGSPLTVLVSSMHKGTVERELEHFRSGNEPNAGRTIEVAGKRRDGPEFPLELSLSPWRSGERTFLTGIARDMTEQKKAEEDLRDSEIRFRALMATIDEIVFEFDREARCLGLWTSKEDFLFAPKSGLVGKRISDVLRKDLSAPIEAAIRRVLGSGVPETVGCAIDLPNNRSWSIGRVTPIPSDDGYKSAYVVVTDITDRKQAEERLRRQNGYLAALHQTRLELIDRLDLPDLLKAMVIRAGALVGTQHGYVSLVRPDGRLIIDVGVGFFEQVEGALLEPGEGLSGAVLQSGELVLVDNFDRWAYRVKAFPRGLPGAAVGIPLRTDDHVIGAFALAHEEEGRGFEASEIDLLTAFAELGSIALQNAQLYGWLQQQLAERDEVETGLRGREEQVRRASDAKSEFLAHISHELRTPLSSILIAAEMLSDAVFGDLEEAKVRDLSGRIVGGGRHLIGLIDDLADLSLIESGRLDLRPQVVSLEALFEEVRAGMAPVADERALVLDIPSGEDHRLLADPLRFRQVLLNLLTNAMKFTEAGGRVWVEVSGSEDAVAVSVHDTGIGIAPADLERIFEPFERASGKAVTGAGLGLAISRRIVEQHGGKLEVASEMGRGSTFTISVPRGAAVASDPVDGAYHTEGRLASGSASVLLIEDDPAILDVVKTVLETAGYSVDEAATPDEALGRVQSRCPDIVLLDMRLGDADGLEVVRRIREDPSLRRLPVVGLSANAMPSDVERALAAGCDNYLVKPISARGLLETVSEVVASTTQGWN